MIVSGAPAPCDADVVSHMRMDYLLVTAASLIAVGGAYVKVWRMRCCSPGFLLVRFVIHDRAAERLPQWEVAY